MHGPGKLPIDAIGESHRLRRLGLLCGSQITRVSKAEGGSAECPGKSEGGVDALQTIVRYATAGE